MSSSSSSKLYKLRYSQGICQGIQARLYKSRYTSQDIQARVYMPSKRAHYGRADTTCPFIAVSMKSMQQSSYTNQGPKGQCDMLRQP